VNPLGIHTGEAFMQNRAIRGFHSSFVEHFQQRLRFRKGWILTHRGFEGGDGLPNAAATTKGYSKQVVRRGIVKKYPDRCSGRLGRVAVATSRQMTLTKSEMRSGVFGIELKRLAEALISVIPLAQLNVDLAHAPKNAATMVNLSPFRSPQLD
jgi:hypothetical protein